LTFFIIHGILIWGGGGIAGNESGLVVTECIGIDERFLSIADGGGVG
jgi:hypothetical protein